MFVCSLLLMRACLVLLVRGAYRWLCQLKSCVSKSPCSASNNNNKKKTQDGRSTTPGDPLCPSALHPSSESRGKPGNSQHRRHWFCSSGVCPSRRGWRHPLACTPRLQTQGSVLLFPPAWPGQHQRSRGREWVALLVPALV